MSQVNCLLDDVNTLLKNGGSITTALGIYSFAVEGLELAISEFKNHLQNNS